MHFEEHSSLPLPFTVYRGGGGGSHWCDRAVRCQHHGIEDIFLEVTRHESAWAGKV